MRDEKKINDAIEKISHATKTNVFGWKEIEKFILAICY